MLMYKVVHKVNEQALFSTFSSIYDLFGLGSLFFLDLKGIISKLYKWKLKWDEEIPVHHKSQ